MPDAAARSEADGAADVDGSVRADGGGTSPAVCEGGMWDHDGDPESACQPWTDCQPGQSVENEGTVTQDRRCSPCAAGTFTAETNAGACRPWSICPAGTLLREAGSEVADRVCIPCPSGSFSTSDNAITCQPWADCPPGQFVSQPGSADSDRQCTTCPGGLHSVEPNSECRLRLAAIAAGYRHTCGLTAQGRAICWGQNYDQEAAPPAAGRFSQIAAGDGVSCGIRSDTAAIECWGRGTEFSLPAELSSGSFRDVVVSDGFACAIRTNDTLLCWGSDSSGRVSGAPNDVPLSSIALGPNAGCGLTRESGSIVCWGSDFWGLVSEAPSRAGFSLVAVDGSIACAIQTVGGAVECWGLSEPNARDQWRGADQLVFGRGFRCARHGVNVECFLYGGEAGMRTVSDLPEGVAFESISAGFCHVCGIDAETGFAYCWGEDPEGQVGGMPNSRTYRSVSSGFDHTCAVQNEGDRLHCWGADFTFVTSAPTGRFDAVAAGALRSACAIENGTLRCWGDDRSGLVSDAPTEVAVTQVAMGRSHACALRDADSSAICWGDDLSGQVSGAPTGMAFTTIAVGFGHSCGLTADGEIVCWGLAGDSPTSNVTFSMLAAGASQTCGLRQSDGHALCWSDGRPPRPPPYDLAFDAIRMTGSRTCALVQNSDEVRCWSSFSRFEHSIAGLTDLSVGRSHMCGVRADQTLQCWGHYIWNPRVN